MVSNGGRFLLISALLVAFCGGCWSRNGNDVVVYAALDREFSETILADAQAATGLRVLPKYDLESTKTVGLVTRIQAEAGHPQCDLFWNNEILHTIRLKQLGLLRPIDLEGMSAFPPTFQDAEGHWYGFAARARVLIVNTELYPDPEQRPSSILDLADRNWPTSRAMAKPLFGTTATHAAVLAATWDRTRFEGFFTEVAELAQIVSGNKQVAQGVAVGEFGFGITDTDDALIELERGAPVAIIFPDQLPGQMGALFIPNAVCCLKDSPNPAGARRLAEYLLRPEVEQQLSAGPSGQIPLHQSIRLQSRVLPSPQTRWMEADFESAARQWDTTAKFLTACFHGADRAE